MTSTTPTDKINTTAQFKKTKRQKKKKEKQNINKAKALILPSASQSEREREFIRPGPRRPANQRERERVIEIINKGWTIERERGTLFIFLSHFQRDRERKREKIP